MSGAKQWRLVTMCTTAPICRFCARLFWQAPRRVLPHPHGGKRQQRVDGALSGLSLDRGEYGSKGEPVRGWLYFRLNTSFAFPFLPLALVSWISSVIVLPSGERLRRHWLVTASPFAFVCHFVTIASPSWEVED